jgi:hypothetical protein
MNNKRKVTKVKKMKLKTLAALAIAVVATSAFADGPTTPTAGPAAPAAAPKPEEKKVEEKKAHHVADEMISPGAAEQVDQEDLIKRLTGGDNSAPAPGNSVKKLDEVLERMNASADLLGKRDPGEITQETQHRIVMDLDVLIEEAQKQEQKGGGKSQQQKPGEGQKRQQSQSKGQQPGQASGGNQAAQDSNIRDGSTAAALGEGSLIDARNDKWARLPARFRDDIASAQNAEVLPTYKTPMERFYETLAKPDKPK